jgi:hypothetical protein
MPSQRMTQKRIQYKPHQNQKIMKMEKATKDQITRNVILSLFIYLLPIAAMFVTFLITGQRPWEKKTHAIENNKTITSKNSQNNGSND